MQRPQWDRIQEIYYSTLPLALSERREFVASACDHDPVLVREVNSLLEADYSSAGFLETPVFEIGLKIISSNPINSDAASSADNLIGTTIDGRYLVESELGQGGMGKVYLARDLELHHRPVVIKILFQASLKDPYLVKKFKQEVEALARVDHPNVVSVLGAGELLGGKPYIVMQYVSGTTLRSQIPGEGMNLERAALILKQIGNALDDVHEKGIFHRDLKPDNIMLQWKSGTELVKVVDFGIAKVKDSVVGPTTVENVSVGTLLYMSPEQLRGERITAASDIYSMAVIAYEVVTGRRPFSPASAAQLLELQRAGVRVKPLDLRTNLSTEAQAVILRGLSFAAAARYQSASEFGDSLARALMNEGATARSPARFGFTKPPYPTGTDAPATIQAGFEPAWPRRTQNDSARRLFGGRINRLVAIGSLLVFLVCVGVLLSVYLNRQNTETESPPGPVTSVPQRSFSYWLTVQRMRDRKRYLDPFPSSGQEIYESGDKFQLNVSSPEPGYVYVFNEGPPEPNDTSFTILYPTPSTNAGSATLGANQILETNWNTFKGESGSENFWIVWSTSPVAQLEAAKTEAFEHPKGGLTDQNLVAVKQFLISMKDQGDVKSATYKATKKTTVRGSSDVLVKLVELNHR